MRSKSILIVVIVFFSPRYVLAGTWTSIDYPGAGITIVHGISGTNIVGSYGVSSATHGFLYDGMDWTTLDYPSFPQATYTIAHDISGGSIVGSYAVDDDGFGPHGFLYDGTDWITLDYPGHDTAQTHARGVSSGNVVGTSKYPEAEQGKVIRMRGME